MIPSHKSLEKAKQIFDRINDSYMAFNKGANHGINHNTSLLIADLISSALDSTRDEALEEAARVVCSHHGEFAPHKDCCENYQAIRSLLKL